ncbi:MAG TPA: cyclic nucleotide-binding domain-containing protein [Actinomycetota bacterium]|jgi:CRP-like cAMP-binding protein|nr:cyclic nucleotide-binding domain-containing protein [Actinomycetota bacterium]
MHPEPEDLQRVPLFAALTDDERAQVATWFEIQEHDAGERIVHEGSPGYGFFVLDDGEVRIEHDGHEVGRLSPGDVFGELALLGDGRRHADVIAVTDVRVLSLFGTHFREMQSTMPRSKPGSNASATNASRCRLSPRKRLRASGCRTSPS